MHRRLPRAERRAQLIGVATDKFGERGFFPTSMDDIAEAAGITKPVLYQHFASKEDLYIAVIENIGSRISQSIEDLPTEAANTRERIEAGIGMFFDLMSHQSSTLRLFFGTEFITDNVQQQVTDVVDKVAQSIGHVVSHTRQLNEQEALVIGHSFAAAVQASAKQAIDASAEERDLIRTTLVSLLADGLQAFRQD